MGFWCFCTGCQLPTCKPFARIREQGSYRGQQLAGVLTCQILCLTKGARINLTTAQAWPGITRQPTNVGKCPEDWEVLQSRKPQWEENGCERGGWDNGIPDSKGPAQDPWGIQGKLSSSYNYWSPSGIGGMVRASTLPLGPDKDSCTGL